MLFRSRRTPYATLVALLVLMLFATPSSADSLGVNVELVYDKYPIDITWSIKRYIDDLRTWENAVAVYANDYECAREDPVSGWTTYVDGPSPARGFFAWRKGVRIWNRGFLWRWNLQRWRLQSDRPRRRSDSSGRRGSQMFGSAKDSVLDDGNRFYSLKVV